MKHKLIIEATHTTYLTGPHPNAPSMMYVCWLESDRGKDAVGYTFSEALATWVLTYAETLDLEIVTKG